MMVVVVAAAAAWVDLWVLSSFSSSLGSNVWSAVPTATDRFSHLLREQNDFGFLRYAHLAHGGEGEGRRREARSLFGFFPTGLTD